MLSALVAVDEPLGDVVARGLETALPRWQIERVSSAVLKQLQASADLVIVDEAHCIGGRPLLAAGYTPVIVLGIDLQKPFSLRDLRAKALASARLPVDDDDLVVVDPPLRQALRIVESAAPRAASVLITGPTGVGKELLARRVHTRSGRRGPFVPINCAALGDGLAESTLFGHARGAFTGAAAALPGAFVEADGGTLFLDEVGELDLRLQAKLLRVLEDGAVRSLGAPRSRAIAVRVVAATNRDLMLEAASGHFRRDLYFRLATFTVQVPPLQQRPGDLAALVQRFVRRQERGSEVRLTPEALALLSNYAWPGNVRELRNVVERALALARGSELDSAELHAIAPELVGAPRATGSLETRERQAIDDALLASTGSLTRAAAELGIHRSTLWRKMRRLNQRTSAWAARPPEIAQPRRSEANASSSARS